MDEGLYKPVLRNGQYSNPEEWSSDGIEAKGFTKWKIPDKIEFVRMRYFSKYTDKSEIPGVTSSADQKELDETLPINTTDFTKLKNPPKDGIQVMWIGHASMVIQFDGITVLTDPLFSHRCAPIQMYGVGCPRYREASCKVSDLPEIDAVIISHDHYDHLDFNSVSELNERFGEKIHWFVPLGHKSWFQRGTGLSLNRLLGRGLDCKNVTEMNWWDETELPGREDVKFICTPAQHWCQRGPTDLNKRLWCSWVVKSSKHKFFFAGDTGYCPAFKQIGNKYGPFNVAALPIGAYEPRDYMKPQHVSPEQAVQIFQEINVSSGGSEASSNAIRPDKKFVGIHWGTFKQLGCYEHYLEPPTLVEKTMEKLGIPKECFLKLGHGDVATA